MRVKLAACLATDECVQVNHTLTSLHLFDNDIGADGAAAIGDALKVWLCCRCGMHVAQSMHVQGELQAHQPRSIRNSHRH